MEENTENKNILSYFLSLIKFTIIFFLIYLYIEKWIKSAKERNWIVFCIMSIIPVMMIYCLIEKIYNNHNNVYSQMVDAQIKAWENQ